jgi:hypothetical protein
MTIAHLLMLGCGWHPGKAQKGAGATSTARLERKPGGHGTTVDIHHPSCCPDFAPLNSVGGQQFDVVEIELGDRFRGVSNRPLLFLASYQTKHALRNGNRASTW